MNSIPHDDDRNGCAPRVLGAGRGNGPSLHVCFSAAFVLRQQIGGERRRCVFYAVMNAGRSPVPGCEREIRPTRRGEVIGAAASPPSQDTCCGPRRFSRRRAPGDTVGMGITPSETVPMEIVLLPWPDAASVECDGTLPLTHAGPPDTAPRRLMTTCLSV
ncbi:hypothetical protein AAFF_G00389930 [Aldrovandia affinis]|uniref:Uncharacterized protein n=1 Tax=Aldrovandia affinis TaxID=143900 RepID=A0AAD7WL51_9TELE|nr:hypothetical protein AAFF_G00389930 [Aldrovandia affinis]